MHIDPGLLAELHLLETTAAGQSIQDFVPRMSPVMPGGIPGLAPTHLRAFTDILARMEYEPQRVCVSVPPRHSKSETVVHAAAWWLTRHPEQTIAYTSYSSEFALSRSARIREICEAAGVKMKSRKFRSNEWRTAQGGGVIATGVGGPLTGLGCNILIVDDPLKNREEAESSTIREKTWGWFTSTAMTRLTPGGSAIVVHTRWHVDDLIGRLRKHKTGRIPWQIINLPALSQEGAPLWPEGGWTTDALADKRAEIGEYDWASLYMGNPRPKGGRMFEEPSYYDKPNISGAARVLISCDPAATKSTHADYSAIVTAACYLDAKRQVCIDVLDVKRMQVEIPFLARLLAEEQAKWRCPVVVEAVGGFKAVPQILRTLAPGVRIIEIQPTTDKFTRALPCSAAWNAGRIQLPKNRPWLVAFVDEVTDFTGLGDAHDDQVDALAHLLFAATKFFTPHSKMKASEVSRYMPFG